MYVTSGGWVSVKQNSGPRSGPLQGVARSVVKMPLKNAPPAPSCCCSLLDVVYMREAGNRHFPHAQKAEGEREHDHDHRDLEPRVGELLAPDRFCPRRNSASGQSPAQEHGHDPRREPHIQGENAARLWPPCWANESTLRPITGSTQGMRFRIRPPKQAEADASARRAASNRASPVGAGLAAASLATSV